MKRKTVILGDEHDIALKQKLVNAITELGWAFKDSSLAVGGSQELETTHFEQQGKVLAIEAETYIGLSITGSQKNVDEIAELVKKFI